MALKHERHPTSRDADVILSPTAPAASGTLHATGPAPLRHRLAPVADTAGLPEVLQALGVASESPPSARPDPQLPLWCLRPATALFHEGAPADTLHIVRSGSLKIVKSSEDGYHQVLSFAGPGDVLGFESLHRGQHRSSAIALEVCTVFALSVSGLDTLRQQSPAFGRALQNAISRQLDGASDTAELMAAVAADARLARFLLWLSARMRAAGQSAHRLHLRMCRRDIASLLGVAHETVSRSFTNLAEDGLIQVTNREVTLLDDEGLRQRARFTRGSVDEPAPAHRAPPTGQGGRPLRRVEPPLSQHHWFPPTELASNAAA